MHYHIPNETAFNGDEMVKKALLDSLTPKAWLRAPADEMPDNIAPLFSLAFDESSTKELYKFYGIHYPFWCLVVFLYFRLEEKTKRTWLLTLIKAIKPGASMRDMNFEYLTWATHRTKLKPGKFSAEDRKDLETTRKIVFESATAEISEKSGVEFILWAVKAISAKAEWLGIQDKKEIERMFCAGGIVGARLSRLCTPTELAQQLLTIVCKKS